MHDNIPEIAELAGVTEDEVKEYFRKADEYVDSLPSDIEVIDGDEMLDYIYAKADLDPNIIERISEAELEVMYSDEE